MTEYELETLRDQTAQNTERMNQEFEQNPTYFGKEPIMRALRPKEQPRLGQQKNPCPPGSFSISDWTGYPENLPKPTGPFRLLSGEAYENARREANRANRRLHEENPDWDGLQIHEIQPVKFGGSPTDLNNKIPLTQENHIPATVWWNQLTGQLGSDWHDDNEQEKIVCFF